MLQIFMFYDKRRQFKLQPPQREGIRLQILKMMDKFHRHRIVEYNKIFDPNTNSVDINLLQLANQWVRIILLES
jgi:hypothetical protein